MLSVADSSPLLGYPFSSSGGLKEKKKLRRKRQKKKLKKGSTIFKNYKGLATVAGGRFCRKSGRPDCYLSSHWRWTLVAETNNLCLGMWAVVSSYRWVIGWFWARLEARSSQTLGYGSSNVAGWSLVGATLGGRSRHRNRLNIMSYVMREYSHFSEGKYTT